MGRLIALRLQYSELSLRQKVQPDGTTRWLPSINQTLESPYDALNLIKVPQRLVWNEEEELMAHILPRVSLLTRSSCSPLC